MQGWPNTPAVGSWSIARPPSGGGSGRLANWELAARAAASDDKVWLAGGLTPSNVAEAIATVKPYGVDVASGVEESPGVKDEDKLRAFVEAVRGME